MAKPTSTSAKVRWPASGSTNHIAAVSRMQIPESAASQGLRRPPASATAPRTGPVSAMATPARLIAVPQAAVPLVTSAATSRVT